MCASERTYTFKLNNAYIHTYTRVTLSTAKKQTPVGLRVIQANDSLDGLRSTKVLTK